MKQVGLLALFLTALGGAAFGGIISLGSQSVSVGATFLEQSSNDNCSVMASAQCTGASFFAPTFINLVALGVNPGDTLQIIAGGSICYVGGSTCSYVSPIEVGVFDTNTTLLGPSNLNRLPGAVASELPNATTSAFYGPINTTISQDFRVPGGTGVTVTVPNAQYLVVGIKDSFFSDNMGNAWVQLYKIATDPIIPPPPPVVPPPPVDPPPPPVVPTPEPGTFGVALAGILAFAAGRKRLHRS